LGREAEAVPRRVAVDLPLFEPVRLELDRALPDEPFLLVDLFVLEPPLDELLLEDRVVSAIVYRLTCFRASSAFRAGGPL
jgi:hypothetical protein